MNHKATHVDSKHTTADELDFINFVRETLHDVRLFRCSLYSIVEPLQVFGWEDFSSDDVGVHTFGFVL